MPLWLKIVLAFLLVIVIVIVGVVGAGVYFWKQHGTEIVGGMQKTMGEAREFGEKTDNQGCVDEGAKRYRQAEGLTELMQSSMFLRACLDASRETPGFCDAVPGPLEFTKTAKWRVEQCEKYGMKDKPNCGSLFQQVQQYCEQRGRR